MQNLKKYLHLFQISRTSAEVFRCVLSKQTSLLADFCYLHSYLEQSYGFPIKDVEFSFVFLFKSVFILSHSLNIFYYFSHLF